MTHESTAERRERQAGIAYTSLSFAAWGVLPLYWKHLDHIPASEILSHRIVWSFVLVAAVLLLYGRCRQVKATLSSRSALLGGIACGVLISANWFTYIWAVNSGHVVETSLGYYINPLFNIALGILVLKERLDRWQVASLLLAAAGVTIMTVQFGTVPWVALSLALTFSLYGLAKKLVQADALVSLALETSLVTPAATLYLLVREWNGTGSLGHVSLTETLMLVGAGLVTALPLLWFAEGAKRVPLSTVGFLQYLSPTITLLIGVFLFGEPFTGTHWLSFGLIWCALAVFTLSRIVLAHRAAAVVAKETKTAG